MYIMNGLGRGPGALDTITKTYLNNESAIPPCGDHTRKEMLIPQMTRAGGIQLEEPLVWLWNGVGRRGKWLRGDGSGRKCRRIEIFYENI